MASIDTLIEDIQRLFDEGHDCNPDNVAQLGQAIAEVVASRLKEAQREREPFRLRMSNIGRDERQLWYDAHSDPKDPKVEKLDASVKTKFLFGDILERLLIFLAQEAKHDVSNYQDNVDVDGVTGSLDCRIDGVLVDCKSASTYSFAKFRDGTSRRDDPFGYMWQLAGYNQGSARDDIFTDGAFFAIDKTLGHICLMRVPAEEFKLYDVKGRIAHLKEIIALPEPPPRCHDDIPDGKSGNRKLGISCSYCKHKENCWPGLQKYGYAGGPRWLTQVVREPKVDKEDNQ